MAITNYKPASEHVVGSFFSQPLDLLLPRLPHHHCLYALANGQVHHLATCAKCSPHVYPLVRASTHGRHLTSSGFRGSRWVHWPHRPQKIPLPNVSTPHHLQVLLCPAHDLLVLRYSSPRLLLHLPSLVSMETSESASSLHSHPRPPLDPTCHPHRSWESSGQFPYSQFLPSGCSLCTQLSFLHQCLSRYSFCLLQGHCSFCNASFWCACSSSSLSLLILSRYLSALEIVLSCEDRALCSRYFPCDPFTFSGEIRLHYYDDQNIPS